MHEAVADERPCVGIIPDNAAQVQGMQIKRVTTSGAVDDQLTAVREPLVGTEVIFGAIGRHFVVITPDQLTELWSLPGQKPIAQLKFDQPFWSFFSNDGKTFYSSTRAGKFRSWSLDGVSASRK